MGSLLLFYIPYCGLCLRADEWHTESCGRFKRYQNARHDAVAAHILRLVESLGSEIIVHFPLDAEQYVVADAIEDDAEKGLGSDEDTSTFVARVSPRSNVSNGEPISLTVDTSRLHFFDIETGLAIR